MGFLIATIYESPIFRLEVDFSGSEFFQNFNPLFTQNMKIQVFWGEIEILGGKIQIWVGKIDFGGFEIRTKLDFWRSRKIGSKFFGVRKSKVFVRNPKFFLVNSGSQFALREKGIPFLGFCSSQRGKKRHLLIN